MAERLLTLDMLINAGACLDAQNYYREWFGTSVTVSEPFAIEHSHKCDWVWAAHNLLSNMSIQHFLRAKNFADDTWRHKVRENRSVHTEKERAARIAYYPQAEIDADEAQASFRLAVKRAATAQRDGDEAAYANRQRILAVVFARLYVMHGARTSLTRLERDS